MIPNFPRFKKITITDKKELEKIVSKYPPHSSFNFTNIFLWDIRNERKISKLNNNLIVYFTDYETREPFISFLGTNKCIDTTNKLLHYINKSNNFNFKLRFITPETIKHIQHINNLHIEEDRDNFDYLYLINKFIKYLGAKHKKHRHLSNRFIKEYSNTIFKIENLNKESIQKEIISVLKSWENRKIIQRKNKNFSIEKKAIMRLLKNTSELNLILSCIYYEKKMIAFSIDEILPNNSAISHFIKADNSFKGIYEYFNKEIAVYLSKKNINLWNWQQDLGITNLRMSKLGYNPVSFLKRYSVSLK